MTVAKRSGELPGWAERAHRDRSAARLRGP